MRKYEVAAHHVFYCSAENGCQLPTHSITKILLDEEIFGDDLDDPALLIEDLVDDDGTDYVRKDPYSPLEGGDEYIESWDEFWKCVKTKYRYTSLVTFEDDFNEINNIKKFFELD